MTASVTAHPSEQVTRYTVRDHAGRPIGAVCHYPDRHIWTVTVGSRVVSLYPSVYAGGDQAAKKEAARLAGVLTEHRGMRCRAGLYPRVVEPCRCDL